jgi:hypothetical protein
MIADLKRRKMENANPQPNEVSSRIPLKIFYFMRKSKSLAAHPCNFRSNEDRLSFAVKHNLSRTLSG